ncbi:MAG: hypothetical protein WCX64_01970 [Candidatus Micrarchaeia archaeon]
MSLKKSNAKQPGLPARQARSPAKHNDVFTKGERSAVDGLIAQKFGNFAPGNSSVELVESDGKSIVDVRESIVTDEKGDKAVSDTRTVIDKTGVHVQQATVADASDPKIFMDLLYKLNAEPVDEDKMRSFEERLAKMREKLRKPKHAESEKT